MDWLEKNAAKKRLVLLLKRASAPRGMLALLKPDARVALEKGLLGEGISGPMYRSGAMSDHIVGNIANQAGIAPVVGRLEAQSIGRQIARLRASGEATPKELAELLAMARNRKSGLLVP